ARRLFIGNVAVHFTAQIVKAPSPKLVMNFTSPVNPMIATEPGKLEMIFTHDAVVAPGSPTLTFDSTVMPSAAFIESNGAAEITVTSSGAVMASFSNDGRTITIAPPSTNAAQTQTPTQSAASPQVQTPRGSAPVLIASTSSPAPGNQHVFAIVDAAHGGDERGAALSDQWVEKNVTLAIARILRSELTARGVNTTLVRDGDVSVPLDQRAAIANASGAAIYICVHATTQGDHLGLYTAFMQNAGANHGPFLDWDSAQTRYEPGSQLAAINIANELRTRQLPVRTFVAPLRPLRNITTAALAIEVNPLTGNISQLTSPEFQRSVAGAVAAGVADLRDKFQGVPK
ncbi:MAG TPA: N-acetylmuramoyl-L-alanine amidase, partial [Terriglobales bacterium]|nr:N-acetylmuramoyl-L-alanine amidase [Terriglobales bacterium]